VVFSCACCQNTCIKQYTHVLHVFLSHCYSYIWREGMNKLYMRTMRAHTFQYLYSTAMHHILSASAVSLLEQKIIWFQIQSHKTYWRMSQIPVHLFHSVYDFSVCDLIRRSSVWYLLVFHLSWMCPLVLPYAGCV
jgi:hypothetical protein